VPVFNHARGIVRKCDMCKGRLEAGEAPACVQACPNGAIAIKVVDVAAVASAAATGAVVAGAPPSSITVPTTTYRSAKGRVDELLPRAAAGTATAHPELAVMLVLTQLAVGAFITDLLLGIGGGLHALVAVVAAAVAIGASVLHLGRPQYCYRAVIGLRHSWLSREVVAFGAFTGLAALDALVPSGALGWVAAACGVFGVVCSVLIYTSTRRWRPASVIARFSLTSVTGGLVVVGGANVPHGWLATAGLTLVLAAAVALELVERQRFFTNASPPR
jgi:hypothetical protein